MAACRRVAYGCCRRGACPSPSLAPAAVARFSDPIWPAVFADYEFEESLGPLALRHPFLDLRVLEFMLSVPTLPWAREKLLLREAMRGHLPPEVLARRKTPHDSTLPFGNELPGLSRDGILDRYVDTSIVSAGNWSGRLRKNALAVHVLDPWLTKMRLAGAQAPYRPNASDA